MQQYDYSHERDVQWMKSDTKGGTLYASFYIKHSNRPTGQVVLISFGEKVEEGLLVILCFLYFEC